MQITTGNIEVRVVENHEMYKNVPAILKRGEELLPILIVRTSRTAATVKHSDGQLQKAPWSNLLVATMVEVTEDEIINDN